MRFHVRRRRRAARRRARSRCPAATTCRTRSPPSPSRSRPTCRSAIAADALESFRGVERRFETKGSAGGVRVVDDYGHHPTEIRATLAAARGLHSGRIVVVFQPHRYTRTRDLFEDFTDAFHDADRLMVTEIYAAGEEKIPGIESAALVEAIRARGHRGVRASSPTSGRCPRRSCRSSGPGDLVITLGAGSVTRLGPELLRALEERTP